MLYLNSGAQKFKLSPLKYQNFNLFNKKKTIIILLVRP